MLQAEKELGIVDQIILKEERSPEKEHQAKLRQKCDFDLRHHQQFRDILLIRKKSKGHMK